MTIRFIYLWAIAYQQKGDNLSAVEYYQQTLDYNSSNIVALNNLAVLLEQAGMFDDAIERYSQIIELDPSYKRAYNNLASIYARQKEYGKAKKYFKQAVEIDSSYLDAHYNLGMIYEQEGDIEKALEEFRFVFLNNSQYPNLGDKIAKLETGQAQPGEKAAHSISTDIRQVKRHDRALFTTQADNEAFRPK